jgi:hypothetical protein
MAGRPSVEFRTSRDICAKALAEEKARITIQNTSEGVYRLRRLTQGRLTKMPPERTRKGSHHFQVMNCGPKLQAELVADVLERKLTGVQRCHRSRGVPHLLTDDRRRASVQILES